MALLVDSHIHHERMHRWFGNITQDQFATCAITQGTLLRVHMKAAADTSSTAAWEALRQVTAQAQHQWWGDDLSYENVPHRHLQGSAQVTDAWLAELARLRGGKVATLDSGLSTPHRDVAVCLPP